MAILSNTNSNASNDNNNTSSASNTSSKSNNSNTCNNHSNGGTDRNTISNASNDSKYYKQLLAMTASTASYLLCVLLLPLTAHVAACLLLLLPTHLALLLFLLWSAQSPFSASRQQNSKTAKQQNRKAEQPKASTDLHWKFSATNAKVCISGFNWVHGLTVVTLDSESIDSQFESW